MRLLSCGLLWVAAISSGNAANLSGEELRGLDEQVQEIKSDVLDIATELEGLEDRLLYPSNTQVAIFIALENPGDFRLDAVQVYIDDSLAAHYIYSFKELEALQDGGVQRLYTGNVGTGEHRLEVSYTGLKGGKNVSGSSQFAFVKGVEPKLLGLTLEGSALGSPDVELGSW
jgi:hypothetical protein